MSRLYRRKNMTVGDFDPFKGERMRAAWLAMEQLLLVEEGEGWVCRDVLARVGLEASDVQRQTVLGILSRMSAPDGPLERKGSVKTRRYRLRLE